MKLVQHERVQHGRVQLKLVQHEISTTWKSAT